MSNEDQDQGTGSPRRVRVLVVDDNQDSVDTMAMLLRLHGHDVRTAADGSEAIEVAAEFLPNLVFLDLGLPRVDGYEVARRLRAAQTAVHPTLVALTGWGGAEVQRRAHEAGFDHHLVKPTQWDALLQILNSVAEARA